MSLQKIFTEKEKEEIIYKYTVEETISTGDEYAIRGIEVYGNITISEKTTILGKLISPTGEIGSKSIIVEQSGEFCIGNTYDTWGHDISDMVNMENWEVEIQIANNFANNTNDILLNGLYMKIYYTQVDEGEVTIKVNGNDLRWYNCFIQDIKVPIGIHMETKYMQVDGTDTNDPVNQSVREKEIEVTLSIDGCDINETTQLLKQLNQLLVTERDSLNTPIPNILEISSYPGEHWEYILEDVFDADVEMASYETTVKFIIPDGVSFSNDDTVTGAVGRVNSLTKVNPILTVANINTDNLIIVEENTQQTFIINYPFVDTDVIEIDCLSHCVELNPPNDDESYGTELKTYVDISSDWFSLNTDYNFTCDTAIIQAVRYNERG